MRYASLFLFLALTFYCGSAFANIYHFVDSEGVGHYSDAPTDHRFKRMFKPEKPFGPPPATGSYVFRRMLPDGSVWAVKNTNRRGFYYWYLGNSEKELVQVTKGGSVSCLQYLYVLRNNEVSVLDPATHHVDLTWLDGTPGYQCFVATIKSAYKSH